MKPLKFEQLSDAIAATSFVEQMHDSELSWISNRLSWLLVSQSFIIAAHVILVTADVTNIAISSDYAILIWALPSLGLASAVLVGFAIRAAMKVAGDLADTRACLTKHINQQTHANIPLVGAAPELRTVRWTQTVGDLPHIVLPWILAAMWSVLMIF